MIVIAEYEGIKLTIGGYLFEGPSDDPTRIIGHINDTEGEYVQLQTDWRQYCQRVEFDNWLPNCREREAEALKLRCKSLRELLARKPYPISEQLS